MLIPSRRKTHQRDGFFSMNPWRATGIHDENAGGSFIRTSYEPRFRDTGINYENYQVIFIGRIDECRSFEHEV